MDKDPNIQQLLDTIHACEVGLQRLQVNPPLTLCFNEIKAWEAEWAREGAKALTDLYYYLRNKYNVDNNFNQETTRPNVGRIINIGIKK